MEKKQNRLIRLSDAIEAMKKLADTEELNELGYGCSFLPEVCAALREAADMLEKSEVIKHGRWEEGGYACGETEWKCSVCGETEWRTSCNRMKFCMFCGAKMDGGKDDAQE